MKMKLTRRGVLFGLVAFIVLAGVAALVLVSIQPKPTPPNSVAVRRGDLSATATATGKVQATKSARLALPITGYVATIAKHEGDTVNMGEVILTLRADDTVRRVKQAELNLQSRQLDLTRAKAAPRDEDLTIARANLQKVTLAAAAVEAAFNANPTQQNDALRQNASADLEIARANFNRLTNGPTQAELDALQNSITSAQIDLDSAKQSLAQTQLTAPYTSTVTDIMVHEGELAGGGGPLAAVADLSSLEISADIDEIDVASVQIGQTVDIRLDAFPGEKLSGNVVRLFPAASTQRGTTTYGAIIDLAPNGLKIRPGMGASLKIQTLEKKSVLLVPNRTLKNVGTRKAVHVLGPGAQGDVIVETGSTDGNDTEIVSGLSEGDQVQLN